MPEFSPPYGMGQGSPIEEDYPLYDDLQEPDDDSFVVKAERPVKDIPDVWLNRLLPSTEPMKGIDWQGVFGRVFILNDKGFFQPVEREVLVKASEKEEELRRPTGRLPYNLGDILQQFTSMPLSRIHHYANTGEYLRLLFAHRQLIDVLVHVGEKLFAAHRVALACHSVYFARMLLLNQHQRHKLTEVRLKDVDPHAFYAALRFIYTGQLLVNENNVHDLVKVANQLQIPAVLYKCLDFMGNVPVQVLREEVEEVDAETAAVRAKGWSRTPVSDLIHNEQFLQLPVPVVEALLAADDVVMDGELEVFNLALAWLAYDIGPRRRHTERVVRHVRFTCMTPAEIIGATQVNDFIRHSPFCRNRVLEAIWLMTLKGHNTFDPFDCPCPRARRALVNRGPYPPIIVENRQPPKQPDLPSDMDPMGQVWNNSNKEPSPEQEAAMNFYRNAGKQSEPPWATGNPISMRTSARLPFPPDTLNQSTNMPKPAFSNDGVRFNCTENSRKISAPAAPLSARFPSSSVSLTAISQSFSNLPSPKAGSRMPVKKSEAVLVKADSIQDHSPAGLARPVSIPILVTPSRNQVGAAATLKSSRSRSYGQRGPATSLLSNRKSNTAHVGKVGSTALVGRPGTMAGRRAMNIGKSISIIGKPLTPVTGSSPSVNDEPSGMFINASTSAQGKYKPQSQLGGLGASALALSNSPSRLKVKDKTKLPFTLRSSQMDLRASPSQAAPVLRKSPSRGFARSSPSQGIMRTPAYAPPPSPPPPPPIQAPPPPPPPPPLPPPREFEDVPVFKFYSSQFASEDFTGDMTGIEVTFDQREVSSTGDRERPGSRGSGAMGGSGLTGEASSLQTWASTTTTTTENLRQGDLLAVGGYMDSRGRQGSSLAQKLHSSQTKWEKFSEIPETRLNFAAAFLKGKIYICGGYDPASCSSKGRACADTFVFDSEQKKWDIGGRMLYPRAFHAVCVLQGRLYAMGGQDHEEGALRTVEVYDPEGERWSLVCSMGQCRVAPSAAPFLGGLMVVGGYGETSTCWPQEPCPVLRSTEWFEPQTNRWQKRGKLRVPRAQACLVVPQVPHLYLCGGVSRLCRSGVLVSLPDIDCYDPNTDQWLHLTDLSTARHNAGATCIGSKVYVVGGVSTDINQMLRSVECYDTVTHTWDTSLPELPLGAKSMACIVVSG